MEPKDFFKDFFRHAMKLSIKNWVLENKVKVFLVFLDTSNEAAYRKYPLYDPRDHATHRQFLIFTHAVNCQTEAKEDAYMKMKLEFRGSAWNNNMDVVFLLNGRM